MKKSLKILFFVLPAIVVLLIITVTLISQVVGEDLKNTIESAVQKPINSFAHIFSKIAEFIILCGRSVWNAYIKYVFNIVTPIFVTGLWYEVLIKVAGLLSFLILVTGIFKFVAWQRRDEITGSTSGTIYVVGIIWLLFCALVCASLIGGFVVFGEMKGVTPDPNLGDPNSSTLKTTYHLNFCSTDMIVDTATSLIQWTPIKEAITLPL